MNQMIDLGNNESATVGIIPSSAGHLAMTFTESKSFRTWRGAIAWLARRGYTATGKKVQA
jgi:hypothetical protein